ncbi:hypothetical protein OIU85_021775 [Salix viminalis]|uniref:Uncharacterized protein n=1 Tax=Salix viminalis TaxID=40686 RepID=A0A9Q0ZDZ8_SALVM|nr:hypothetical protein OIU85_021775 [Salix viminalis]
MVDAEAEARPIHRDLYSHASSSSPSRLLFCIWSLQSSKLSRVNHNNATCDLCVFQVARSQQNPGVKNLQSQLRNCLAEAVSESGKTAPSIVQDSAETGPVGYESSFSWAQSRQADASGLASEIEEQASI